MKTLTGATGGFQKHLLPPVRSFYEHELGELGPERKGWCRVLAGCPFHPSKSRKSFFVNVLSDGGGFHCFGCGISGDIISFTMKRYSFSFTDAAKKLRVWDGGLQIDAVVIRQIRIEKERQEQQRQAEHELERRYYEAEHWLYCIEKIYRCANDCLSEIRHHGSTDSEEEENQWTILSLALDEIRDAEQEFLRLRCSWPRAPFNERARNWRESR